MPPKRKADGVNVNEELTSREWKKQKIDAARTIAVQPAASGSSSRVNSNVAGSSLKSVRFDSMAGLPGALDVERFAEARTYEINAMHTAMKNASAGATKRAWQELPRHLRRRAASHDVRRVPLRLREKAKAEMDPMRRIALGRSLPKRGKSKQISRTKQLIKRQREKTWLETHIWHAKRMHMQNMWGYRLAVEPTEKSFRPSHRASVHGSILHDASYFALIELNGLESVLVSILDSCCDYQVPSPGAKRYLTGARTCETHIYKYGKYPFDLIAPVTIIWRPVVNKEPTAPDASGDFSNSARGAKRKQNQKGNTKVGPKEAVASSGTDQMTRSVWVRVHPAVVGDVHLALRTAASFALEAVKKASPDKQVEVEIADLRDRVNVFEITGPKSSQVVKGALKPAPESKREEFDKFWKSLDSLQTTSSLPRGMIVGFTVHDPRLSFPPKNVKLNASAQATSSPASTVFPSASLAQCDIWDESVRTALQKPRYKKKDIDNRRSKNLIPGTALQAEHQDDRVPVMLIQRSIEGSSPITPSTPTNGGSPISLHGWTIIIPAGWGMPFFSSLTYTGTRVGGQRERQTQSFEGGCPYFPRDYPSTEAYDEYAETREEEEREAWGRKPPAKRPNYDKLSTRSPWMADWDVVLGLKKSSPESGGDFIETQRVPQTQGASTRPVKSVSPWLLRCPDLPAVLEKASAMFNPGSFLLDYINQARAKRHQAWLDPSVKADALWQSALVTVRITPRGRGSPQDLAILYRMDDQEARACVNSATSKGTDDLLDEDTEAPELPPPQDDIIGYITTGHFSLSRGEGCAIGLVPVDRLLELRQQAERLRTQVAFLVKVRNRDQTICRAAILDIL